MKSVNQIFQKNHLTTCSGKFVEKDSTTEKSSTRVPKEMLHRIDKLFLNFDSMYGPIWSKRFSSEGYLNFCKEQWALALVNISNKQIKRAINICLCNEDLPPSLPRFVQLCKQYWAPYHAPAKIKLLTKSANKKIAEFNLQKMRDILNGEKDK